MATKKKTKRANASKPRLVRGDQGSASRVLERPPTADIKSDAQRRCLGAAVLLTREQRKITKRALSDKVGKSESQSQPHLRALVRSGCIRAITEKQEVVVGYELTELGEATFEELVKFKRMPD